MPLNINGDGMKQWYVRLGAGLFVVATLIAAPGVSAVDQSHAGEVAAVNMASPPALSLEQIQDFQIYAQSSGLTLDQVVARFGGQDAFLNAVSQVRAVPGDVVVRAEWGNGSGVIYVKPSGQPAAQSAATTASMQVMVADLPGEVAQTALVEQYASSVHAAGQAEFALSYDVFSDTMYLSVSGDPVPDLAETLGAAAGGAARSINGSSPRLVLSVGDPSMGPSPDSRGGMDYGGCTGAFIVRQTSTYYISTARHCLAAPSAYDGATTAESTVSSSRDLRRTRLVGSSHSATFRWSPTGYRTVKSSANPTFGILACVYGKMSGTHCATVLATDTCVAYAGFPKFCGIARVSGILTQPGDSGGPWFAGTKALGVHSGRWNGVSVFTKIGDLSGLGVQILKG
jgi:streptogrisin B